MGFQRTLLILLFNGSAALLTAQAPRELLFAVSEAGNAPQTRLHAVYATLLVSLILVVLLIFGVLIIKQAGRRATQDGNRPARTEYVDVWRQYRLDESSETHDEEPDPPRGDGRD